MSRRIGTLAEKSLHAALKALYAQPGDLLEYSIEGYVIDIVRPAPDPTQPGQCIEIQTGGLGSLTPKLAALLDVYPVQIVYPIAQERYIVRVDADGVILSRRKSPRRGTLYHLFTELVSLPTFAIHPHCTLEIPLIREEQVWLDDGRGSWRRKHWSIHDRRLLEVLDTVSLSAPAHFAALLPAGLAAEFDSRDLAEKLHQPRYLAQKMIYCLREMGVLQVTGKHGKALCYRVKADQH
jgi:hypothetical protein